MRGEWLHLLFVLILTMIIVSVIWCMVSQWLQLSFGLEGRKKENKKKFLSIYMLCREREERGKGIGSLGVELL